MNNDEPPKPIIATKMKLITPQILANEAAEKFKRQHLIANRWRTERTWLPVGATSYEDVHRQLSELGDKITPADVAKIVNPAWVELPWCSSVDCENKLRPVAAVVEINREDCGCYLCEPCAAKVAALLSTGSVSEKP